MFTPFLNLFSVASETRKPTGSSEFVLPTIRTYSFLRPLFYSSNSSRIPTSGYRVLAEFQLR